MRVTLWAFPLTLILTACAAQPKLTQEQIDAADCGPYPQNYQQIIRDNFQRRLLDPQSAQFRFSQPVKGASYKAPIQGGGVDLYGWVVDAWVNAKNAYGGYTGEHHFQFIIRDGVAKQLITEDDINSLSDSRKMGPEGRIWR